MTLDFTWSAKPDLNTLAGLYIMVTAYPEVIGTQLIIVWAQLLRKVNLAVFVLNQIDSKHDFVCTKMYK